MIRLKIKIKIELESNSEEILNQILNQKEKSISSLVNFTLIKFQSVLNLILTSPLITTLRFTCKKILIVIVRLSGVLKKREIAIFIVIDRFV